MDTYRSEPERVVFDAMLKCREDAKQELLSLLSLDGVEKLKEYLRAEARLITCLVPNQHDGVIAMALNRIANNL